MVVHLLLRRRITVHLIGYDTVLHQERQHAEVVGLVGQRLYRKFELVGLGIVLRLDRHTATCGNRQLLFERLGDTGLHETIRIDIHVVVESGKRLLIVSGHITCRNADRHGIGTAVIHMESGMHHAILPFGTLLHLVQLLAERRTAGAAR